MKAILTGAVSGVPLRSDSSAPHALRVTQVGWETAADAAGVRLTPAIVATRRRTIAAVRSPRESLPPVSMAMRRTPSSARGARAPSALALDGVRLMAIDTGGSDSLGD